jgi:hypothetical protein
MEEKWYTRLLSQIKNSYSGILVVSDPDNLGSVPEIQEPLKLDFHIHNYKSELKLRGFLLTCKNLETPQGTVESSAKRLIIFRHSEKVYFPSDIENKAEIFSWSIKNMFPQLDYETVKSFPASIYQKLYTSCKNSVYSPQTLDQKSTLNLICMWLCGIELQRIVSREQLISFLHTFYQNIDTIPETLKSYLIEIESTFKEKNSLSESIWKNSTSFNGWITSKWQEYRKANPLNKELDIDFFNLSLTGIREKMQYEESTAISSVKSKSIEEIGEILKCDPIDWRMIAMKWGEASYFKDEGLIEEEEYRKLDAAITTRFEPFILGQYKELFIQNSRDNLVTIDRATQYIGQKEGGKKLLFCFDGMAFQEWYCIKAYLEEYGISGFKEHAIYALLPTVTSISRRALFCGEKNTDKLKPEDQGFVEFVESNWENGKDKYIQCFLNAGSNWNQNYLDFEYLGIINNLIDNIAHHLPHITDIKNKHPMQELLKTELYKSELAKTFRAFLDEGYKIFITSDHGTIWCEGNGYILEKYLADPKSKRALKYTEDVLARDYYRNKSTDLYLFGNFETLGTNSIIIPKGRKMFDKKNVTGISHGGVHLEEVIIPFIEVSK